MINQKGQVIVVEETDSGDEIDDEEDNVVLL